MNRSFYEHRSPPIDWCWKTQPNDVIYPAIPSWNGRVLACYRRNSTTRQRDNARAFFQFHDLGNYCLSLGFAIKLFDEQAASAASLSKRAQMNNILAAILAGTIHGIAVADISRLTRDKHGIDPEYIGQLLLRYAEGRLVVYGRPMDLRRQEDWAEYERLTRIASWERDDTLQRLFDGLKITAERAQTGELDVFVRTHVKFGYKRVYLSDADGRLSSGQITKFGAPPRRMSAARTEWRFSSVSSNVSRRCQRSSGRCTGSASRADGSQLLERVRGRVKRCAQFCAIRSM